MPDGQQLSKCFVAYASDIQGHGDAIDAAIEELHTAKLIDIRSWKALAVGGDLIIGKICETIQQSDLFIADITLLNPNVLYELGFAIGLRKKIWVIFDPSTQKAKQEYEQFQTLTTITYTKYSNSGDITKEFYRDQPYSDAREPLLDQLLRAGSANDAADKILYLKPEVITEPVRRLVQRLESSKIPALIDDPEDIRFPSAAWYADAVHSAYGVVCHFLSADHAAAKLNNAKNSFVAGLASGMGKPLLMLAHEPYKSPIDYRDVMRVHGDAAAALSIYDEWVLPLVKRYAESEESRARFRASKAEHAELLDVYLGEPVAEYEADKLEEYFIETSAYKESLNANYSIFVGRKGTGKTATLLKIAAELGTDPRNHICVIMPASFELPSIASLFRKEAKESPFRSYLLESFWEFLIYTELAKSIFDKIVSQPSYYVRNLAEAALANFVTTNQEIVLSDFSTRLEKAVDRLRAITESPGDEREHRERIGQALHNVMLSQLRRLIADVLVENHTVAILVDNLDKGWTAFGDTSSTSELLVALLSAGSSVSEEFHRSASKRKPVALKVIVFMRSDIFSLVFRAAHERDKLPVRRIDWEDSELLLRVIEERFLKAGINVTSRKEIWEHFFPEAVNGLPIQEFLLRSIFPRPRDLIVIVKACLEAASNRGRAKAEEKDVITGASQYAKFAFNAILVEGAPQLPNLEDVLILGFMDGYEILSEYQLLDILSAQEPDKDIEDFISLLVGLTFLGVEVGPNEFEFLDEPNGERRTTARAQKMAETVGERRFKIHPVFHELLSIKRIA